MTQRKKIGLALGSGGARGLSHLGILQRFAEWGIPIHCVAGTSIGAIVGGIYAAGAVEAVSSWLRGLNVVDFARLFAGRPHSTGFLTGRGVDEKLRDFIPYTDYCQLPLPFATVATDIATGEEVVIKEGDLLSGIHASFAIPGVFTSVERDGRQLVDGGLSNPLPISVCRAMGADAVIAVDVNLRPGPPNFRRPKDRLKLFDILTNALKFLENEVSRGTLAAQAPDVVVHPAVGDIGTLDFGCVEMGIAAGLSAADEMRADIEALLE